jgi:hypothetical protein
MRHDDRREHDHRCWDWLRGLGLGQYETSFRENNIDESVLPNLTAEDPKDLGIATVGHRRKLLTLFPRRPDVLQLHQKRKHSVRQVLQWLEMCLQLLPEQFGQVAVLCCLFVRRILGFRLTRWTPLA